MEDYIQKSTAPPQHDRSTRQAWRPLGLAAIFGAMPGSVLGLFLAIIVIGWHGLTLDGPGGPELTTFQQAVIVCGLSVIGATLGAVLTVTVAGFVVLAWFGLRVSSEKQGPLMRATRITIALILMLSYVLLLLVLIKPFS